MTTLTDRSLSPAHCHHLPIRQMAQEVKAVAGVINGRLGCSWQHAGHPGSIQQLLLPVEPTDPAIPLTHTHRNLYPCLQVWVLVGIDTGWPGDTWGLPLRITTHQPCLVSPIQSLCIGYIWPPPINDCHITHLPCLVISGPVSLTRTGLDLNCKRLQKNWTAVLVRVFDYLDLFRTGSGPICLIWKAESPCTCTLTVNTHECCQVILLCQCPSATIVTPTMGADQQWLPHEANGRNKAGNGSD